MRTFPLYHCYHQMQRNLTHVQYVENSLLSKTPWPDTCFFTLVIVHTLAPFVTTKLHKNTISSDKPYSCNHCDFKCSYKHHLTRHIRTHTGEKPFSCDVCGKSFARSGDLKRHQVTHSSEKNYKCDQCGKLFGLKGNLTTHLRIHTGVKPFACDVCGKKFTQLSSRIHHSKRCASTVTTKQQNTLWSWYVTCCDLVIWIWEYFIFNEKLSFCWDVVFGTMRLVGCWVQWQCKRLNFSSIYYLGEGV